MRRPAPARLPALLTVLVLLAAAGAATLWVTRPHPTDHPPVTGQGRGYSPGSLPDGREAPVAVAVRALPAALAYDYRSLDPGLRRATRLMTRRFASEFTSTFETSAARLARDQQAVTNAVVRAAGLVRSDDREALCMVYVDQVLVSSTTVRNPEKPVQVAQNRVLVGLRKVGDSWLVDSIQPF